MLSSAVEHYQRQQEFSTAALAASRRATTTTNLAKIITALQQLAAQDSIDSIDPMLDEQGIAAAPVGLVAAKALAGTASDGRPLETLFGQARDLFSLGLMVVTQIQDAARQAGAVSIAARPGLGYVRMLNPPSCSRCVVQAGKFFRYNEGFLRHPRCDCRHIPTLESMAGDLTTDPQAYFESLTPEEQDRAFTRAGAEAIRLGADIGQVVNARRVTAGMSFAGVPAIKRRHGNLYTTEGATRRSIALQQQAGLRVNGTLQQRLMPESILQNAKDRDDAQRLLRLYGFIIDQPAASRGRTILTQDRREERRLAAIDRRAKLREQRAERLSGSGAGDGHPPTLPVASGEDPDEYPATNTGTSVPWRPSERPRVTDENRRHILDGDAFGGGHRFGTGRTNKTEFPQRWSDDFIMDAVDETLRAPDRIVHSGDKFQFYKTIAGHTVQVAVRADLTPPEILTAYPLP